MYFKKILGIKNIPTGAKLIQREAVRGVVLKDKDLVFMIYTSKGDYKFPGGGIENGESHLTALKREFIEETGYEILDDITPAGLIIEKRPDAFEPNAYFVMKSYYYRCEIVGENHGQSLERYEKDLNFTTKFFPIVDAYKKNKQLIKNNESDINPWVEREIVALENIIRQCGMQI